MSTFRNIKDRAAELARRRRDGDGRVDQEKARIERARAEARREAKRERVQQRTQEARQEERKRVLNDNGGARGIVSSVASTIGTAAAAVGDGDNERLDDVSRAMSTDFDGDGETLADELGLQSAARADAEDRSIAAIEDLANENATRISAVENDLNELSPQSDRQRDSGRRGGRGGGRQQRDTGRESPADLDFGPSEFDPIDDDLFGGGGL